MTEQFGNTFRKVRELVHAVKGSFIFKDVCIEGEIWGGKADQ